MIELPSGLTLAKQLHAFNGNSFGEVYEVSDVRLGNDHSIGRVIRILPGSDSSARSGGGSGTETGWLDSYRNRLRSLVEQTLPYVSTPSGFGQLPNGREYLIGDHDGVPLSAEIPPDKGLPSAEVEVWIEELLTGLAALHAREIFHGDICPANIFLTKASPESKRHVRIADTAIGPVTLGTRGTSRYYPPEWKEQSHEPRANADLYALGLVICEMLLGKSAVASALKDGKAIQNQLPSKLKPKRVSRLVKDLLEPDPKNRPANAGKALEEFRKLKQHDGQRWWKRAALGGLLLLITAMMLGWSMNDQLAKKANELTQLNGRLEALGKEKEKDAREIVDLKAQFMTAHESNGLLNAQIRELKDRLGETSIPPQQTLVDAQNRWREVLHSLTDEGRKDDSNENLKRLRVALGFDGSIDVPPEIRKFLAKWYDAARSICLPARQWFPADPEIKSRYQRALETPWDETRLQEARQRLDSLNAARKVWQDWAYDDNLAWDAIEKLIDDPKFDASTQEILKAWHRELLGRSTKPFVLQLKSGKAPEGWRITREVGVKGKKGWSYTSVHDWGKPTEHKYTSGDASHQKSFQWDPGSEIGICLYGEFRLATGFTKRPLHLEQYFRGPLALWRLHDTSFVEQDGFRLEFEINDCPGPPPERLLKRTMDALK